MASDSARPVAIAALCVFEDIGYLIAAATVESHRKRGAPQALIAEKDQMRRTDRLFNPGVRNPDDAGALLAQSAAGRVCGSVRERSLRMERLKT
jgi:hypothetical protein